MKKILTNLLIIIIISVFAVACGKKQQPMVLYDVIQQRGKIVVGVKDNIPPFSSKDKDGNYVGFEIDLAKKIASRLLGDENAVEFVTVTPSNRISMLNSGQADMIIATMTINTSRLSMVDFTEPYYIAGQTVMVKKSSKIKSLYDLKAKKIGVVFGTTANESIRTVAPSSLVAGFKTYDEAVDALNQGLVDGVAMDDTVLMGYKLKDSSLIAISQKYTQEPYGIALRKGTESTRVLEMLDGYISHAKSSGEINKLKAKWIK